MGIIAEEGTRVHATRVCSIVGNINTIDIPTAGWIRGCADCQIKMIYSCKSTTWELLKCKNNQEETLGCSIVNTGWACDFWTASISVCTINSRSVTIE